MCPVNQHILEDPAHAGCVWPNHWHGTLRQASSELLNVFENTRARPVKICAVLKNYKHIGIAKHGLRSHGFHMRSGEQRCDNRIGELVLDYIGWPPGPRRVNDDLYVRNIWQRVQRNVLQRPDARQQQEQSSSEYEKAVSRAPL